MTINPAAIIAEYNPFHSGHAYHIKKTRELGYTHILCIMSSEFVQRGETAVLDSHFRARRAIMGGADLVIELMPPYCIGSAKDFASAGVNLIKGLGIVNALSFGAECSDIKILAECQDRLSNIKSDDVRKLMRSGMSYPQAVAKLSSGYSDILSGANNTLAIEYIRALKGSSISPVCIKRVCKHDSDSPNGDYASASFLRELLKNDNVKGTLAFTGYLPDTDDISAISRIGETIMYLLCTKNEGQISEALYTGDGIAERIMKNRFTASGLDELYSAAKTRNVTHARVRRAVLCAALGITESDIMSCPPYARILASNRRGFELLSLIKKSSDIPVSTSLAKLSKTGSAAMRCADLTELASKLRFSARSGGFGGYVSQYKKQAAIIL